MPDTTPIQMNAPERDNPTNLFRFRRPSGRKPRLALIALYSFESLGIRYVASSLRAAGFECLELFYRDFRRNTFEYPKPEELRPLISILREKEADIVGISLRSSYRMLAETITREIHGQLGLPVIWGSTHPTVMPEDSIAVCDALCRGDGETAAVELMRRLAEGKDISDVPGFWFKKPDGGVVKNGMAPYVDLDAIPDPSYNAPGKYYLTDGEWRTGDPQWNEGAYIAMSSRGCPHRCNFCTNTFYLESEKGYVRLRSVDRLITEINRAREIMPDIRRIKFYDDLFAVNKKWTDEFVEKYPREVGLPFNALMNPHHVTPPLLEKLKGAGLTIVEMGIQSGAERVSNEIYGRHLSNKELRRAVEALHGSGLRIYYDLIIDNPLETEEDKRAGFEFMLGIPRPYSLFIVSLTHLPGTPLTRKLLREGKITEDRVEGRSDSTLFQWEASLNARRSPEDRFWLALLSLLTKDFVPKPLIRFFSRRKVLMEYPQPLVAFAWGANLVKMAWLAYTMYREGSLTWQAVRRHANFKNLAIK